jgi:hypothetical protein
MDECIFNFGSVVYREVQSGVIPVCFCSPDIE